MIWDAGSACIILTRRWRLTQARPARVGADPRVCPSGTGEHTGSPLRTSIQWRPPAGDVSVPFFSVDTIGEADLQSREAKWESACGVRRQVYMQNLGIDL